MVLPWERDWGNTNLAERVEWQESRGNQNAVSPKGAFGVMQLMPDTARDPGFGVSPLDPNASDPEAENRRVGHDYLNAMLKRYGGDEEAALVAYNWGPGNADKWVAGGKRGRLPRETREYVQNIMGGQAEPMRLGPSESPKPWERQWGAPKAEAQPTEAKPAPPPPEPAGDFRLENKMPLGGKWEPASILPFEINSETGERRFAVPQVARDIYQDIKSATDDPVNNTGAVLRSALLGSPTVAGRLNLAPKVIPQEGAIAAAAQRQGIDMPAAVLGGPVTQNVAKRVSDIPIVGAPLERASRQAISQTGNALRRVEQGYGSGSIPKAGEAAREGLEGYIKGVSKESVTRAYDKVDDLVDSDITEGLVSTRRLVQELGARRRGAALPESEVSKIVKEALSRGGGLTYKGIKDLRTYVGERLDSGVLPADMSKTELRRLYGALTDDLRGVIKSAGGQKALAQWERANRYSALVSTNRERLAAILGAKSDEAIVDRVLSTAGSTSRADIKLLARAKKALDSDTWNEMASAAASRMGRDAEGNFSPDRFITAWGKLTPQGKSALFGQGDLAKSLNDIVLISSRFKELNRYANPSGTGGTLSATAALGGFAAEPFTTATALVGGRVMAHILSRPASAKAISKWMRQAEIATRSRNPLSPDYRAAVKAMAIAIASELGAEETAPRIEKEFQGIVLPGMMGA